MKHINIAKFLVLLFSWVIAPAISYTQNYIPVDVSGFNQDIIAEGSGGMNRATATTTTTFDDNNVSLSSDNVLYAKNFRGNNNQGSPPPFGLPDDGVISSVNLPGAVYHLASFNGNNALVLRQQNSVGSLTLQTPGVFSRIAFLGASSNGSSTFNFTLNFSDGSSFPTMFTVPDWFGGANFAIKSIGRVYRSSIGGHLADEFNGDAENPRLYDNQILIPAPFDQKILTSITITKTSSGGSTGIFAINGITPVNAPAAPVATPATNINAANFTANWLATPNATNYFIDVSDSPTFTTLYSDYNNRSIGNVLTFNVTGLPNAPTYYYRVRASNVSGVSPSSNTIQVCIMDQPTAKCNNISIYLDDTGNYQLSSLDLATIGNGSTGNCGDLMNVSFSVNQSNFSCNDIILGQPNNYAVKLDGIDDFIQSDATNVLKIQPLTIEAWVKPELRNENTTFYPNNVLSNDNPGLYGHGFGANVNASVNQITIEYQNNFRTINNAGLSTSQWQHIAVVYTSGNIKTFVNGILIDDFNHVQGNLSGTSSFWIGKHNDDTSYGTRRFYKGQLDEVRVWHRALTVNEILANMNTTSVGNETDLQLYYTFEDGIGSTRVKDVLGNADANFNAAMDPILSWETPGAPVIPALIGKSINLTVTNSLGNQSSCVATVSVLDTIAPIAHCSSNPINLYLDDEGNAFIPANFLANGISTDNCAADLLEFSLAKSFTCLDFPSSEVNLLVTDASGNSASCTTIVNVIDSIPPTVVCPDTPITIVIDVNQPAILLENQLAVGNSFDNCIDEIIESNQSFQITCTDAPSIFVILSATDASGNSSTTSCIVNIDDAAKPVAIIDSGGKFELNDSTPSIIGNANASTGAGNLPLHFEWSDGTIGAIIEITIPGEYILTVTNTINGCFDTQSIIITDNRSVIPSQPQAIAATQIGQHQFIANWLPTPGATSYLVDVSTSSNFQNFVGIYNSLQVSNVQSLTITGLNDNTIYYYRLRAQNFAGISGYSNIIQAITLEPQFVVIPVSGFAYDIIAEGAGGNNRALSTTTNDIGGFVLYSQSFRGNNNLNNIPPYGLPEDGIITNANAIDVNFQLADYNGNNAIILKSINESSALTLNSPSNFSEIVVLGTSEGSLTSITAILEFSDGASFQSDLTIPDWYDGRNFAVKGIGRMNRSNDVFGPNESSENPRLYNLNIQLPPPFDTKALTKISFTKTSTSGSSVIIALNGRLSNCNQSLVITAENNYCEGNEISLMSSLSDEDQFIWKNPSGKIISNTSNAMINTATLDDSGLYTLEVISSNGCSYSSEIEIDVHPNPTINIETIGLPCESDSIIVQDTESDAISWFWLGPDGFTSIENSIILIPGVSKNGEYTLTVQSEAGCLNSAAYTLDFMNEELLSGNFLISSSACTGDSIHAIDYSIFQDTLYSAEYLWDFGNGMTSTERDPIITYTNTGAYNVVLQVKSTDCTFIIQKEIIILGCATYGTDDLQSFTTVFPNPAYRQCIASIELPYTQQVLLRLLNANGQLISTKSLTGSANYVENLTLPSNGMYFLEVFHELGKDTRKIFSIE